MASYGHFLAPLSPTSYFLLPTSYLYANIPLMRNILPIVQVVLGILLIAGILFQRSDAGLGSAFGQDTFSGVKYEKRGLEKTIFVGTIVIAVLFALSAFAALFVK